MTGPLPAAGPEGRWPAVFQETAEVNVVNVEVFVSDAQGRPVDGLTRQDFELFEGSRRVAIDNFYAVAGGQPRSSTLGEDESEGEASENLRLVLFVDGDNVTAASRKRIFRRLRELVLEHRRGDVEMMLLNLGRSAAGGPLEVRQGFTSTAHDIFVALDELERESVGSDRLDLDRRRIVRAIELLNVEAADPTSTIKGDASQSPSVLTADAIGRARALVPQIDAYAQQRFDQVRRTLDALGQVVDMLAPVAGRKALVYVSDGLPSRPGLDLFEAWAHRVTPIAELASEAPVASSAERYDTTRQVLALVARANAGRVTFYTLDASPPSSIRRGGAESRGAARRLSLESFEEGNRQDSLVLMAESTGGRAGLSASALAATLEGVLTDFDHYYSLGYVVDSGDRREAKDRSIEVRVRGRDDLRLRYRRRFRDRGPEELMRERVLAALVFGQGTDSRENALDVAPSTGEVTAGAAGTFIVPLLVEVPLGKLVLVPEKSEHEARVSMYVAARDAAGRTSAVTRHVCPVRIPNSEVLVALGRKMVCGVRLEMRAGEQHLAVAVRDEVAGVVSLVRFAVDVGAAAAADAAGGKR